jgi:hypothetical protein
LQGKHQRNNAEQEIWAAFFHVYRIKGKGTGITSMHPNWYAAASDNLPYF